ncbi:MAG: toxin-antitoxin system HicB family antitoxin [Thermodesulfovibrionales bacterium]|jgi:predicted HicB family RNase H-like nuclease
MSAASKIKTKKTFPLEIEDSLHKALKHKAIELDISLHAFIIETLTAKVSEELADYNTGDKTAEIRRKG